MSKQAVKSQKFFATMVEWDVSERESLDKKIRWLTVGLIGSGVLIVGLVSAIVPLTVLHEFIPMPVLIDKRTGEYDVRVGMQRIDVTDPKNETRMIADIALHVRARESFTRGEAEQNYRVVFNQLPEDDRNRWRHEYVEKPTAWLNTLGVRDKIRMANPSVQWLPSNPDMPNVRSVQYRFDQIEQLAGKVPTTQPKITTMTFTYDPKAVPSTVEDIATNPFGFVSLNYRTDPAGRKREINSTEPGAQQ